MKNLAKWPVLNRKVVNLQEGKFEVSDQENLNFGAEMLQIALKILLKSLQKAFESLSKGLRKAFKASKRSSKDL